MTTTVQIPECCVAKRNPETSRCITCLLKNSTVVCPRREASDTVRESTEIAALVVANSQGLFNLSKKQ